jgi:amino acid transporter
MRMMAEMGAAFTQEGGPYEWTKLAFGRLNGGSPRSSVHELPVVRLRTT